MAHGGFQRRVRVDERGIVTSHRPVDHEDDHTKQGTWLVVDVPKEIPVLLNDGIAAECLTVVDGRLTWPADAAAQVERRTADLLAAAAKVPSEAEVVAEALELTKEQLDAARARLVAARVQPQEGK